MGSATAQSLADAAKEGSSLHALVSMNLTSNHYPPIPASYVDPVVEAIEWHRNGYDEPCDIDITRATKGGCEPHVARWEGEVCYVSSDDLLTITHCWGFTE